MTVYSGSGAPLQLTARFDVDGGMFYLVQAKTTGTYPDGSGCVGLQLHATDRTAKGWFPASDLRADDGWREIMAAVHALPVTQLPAKEANKILKYYGLSP